MNTVDIVVRDSCGAYVTNRINGVSSSSTSSAEFAARRQAEKLFGAALQGVAKVDQRADASVWRVTADADIYAFAWATGLIQFGGEIPAGACAFAKGPDRALRLVVATVARHAKPRSSGKLLVPGVPEAEGQDAGMTAFLEWQRWCQKRNGKKDAFGVEFANFKS